MKKKIAEEIQERLFLLRDEKYQALQAKIIPNVDGGRIIGVRTPELRNYAKDLCKDAGRRKELDEFLDALPHKYFEENQIHAFVISEEKDFDLCLERVNAFLPFVDNWATCDQMGVKAFRKNHARLLPEIKKWIASGETYTVRFGIKMLMDHFLGEDFDVEYPRLVSQVSSDEYYVKMMVAWYFATALAKKYEETLPFIEKKILEPWTHNKAVQKAVESFRISPEQKAYLKTLRGPLESTTRRRTCRQAVKGQS